MRPALSLWGLQWACCKLFFLKPVVAPFLTGCALLPSFPNLSADSVTLAGGGDVESSSFVQWLPRLYLKKLINEVLTLFL